ncbi:hypothetical protein [Spongiactinospora sp. TRM90649]|uniref:hypothetical protein n=1 Tax=Spongiactinospora sp. TRM90649 TaxID=3031114 RepID=UPI0023F6E767|nr:hypothetical protein [Spongiactinospora sp. TRM90649]MDF5751466.1 hypothetical protein [Spongiactinospora sp. TRM90649]
MTTVGFLAAALAMTFATQANAGTEPKPEEKKKAEPTSAVYYVYLCDVAKNAPVGQWVGTSFDGIYNAEDKKHRSKTCNRVTYTEKSFNEDFKNKKIKDSFDREVEIEKSFNEDESTRESFNKEATAKDSFNKEEESRHSWEKKYEHNSYVDVDKHEAEHKWPKKHEPEHKWPKKHEHKRSGADPVVWNFNDSVASTSSASNQN